EASAASDNPTVEKVAAWGSCHISVIIHRLGRARDEPLRDRFIHRFVRQGSTAKFVPLRANGGNNARSRRSRRGGKSARRPRRSRPGSPSPIARTRRGIAAWR